MTLLEILVRELPKRGGWPDGAVAAVQDGPALNGVIPNKITFAGPGYKVRFCDGHWLGGSSWNFGYKHDFSAESSASDHDISTITREQYESALAAAGPEWNGEGLPPVGCECEYLDSNNEWYPVTIKYASNQIVVICGMTNIFGEEQETEIAKDIQLDKPQFRPIRSEADKKRDGIIQVIERAYKDCPHSEAVPQAIYEAIAEHLRID